MPVITVDRKSFCKLVGRDYSMAFIEERLPMIGVSWEGKEEGKFSIEVNPNRPDMLSIEGLARAFSAFVGLRPGLREYKSKGSKYLIKVDSKVREVRPFIVSGVVKGVRFTDEFIKSIMQLQEKLHVSHCRKRRKVAIGLHDLDKIYFPIIYTTKPPSFKFVPLDQSKEMSLKEILEELPKGRDYAWILEGAKEYPILHDSKGTVLSMPPIINSEDTKIDQKTRNVFLDITATDEKTANEVLNIIVTTFADHGGEIYSVKISYPERKTMTPNLKEKVMEVSRNYINKLLGLNLESEDIIECLRKMGHKAEGKEKIKVRIPCYRTDIMHPFDLAEEVAIGYGYENFKPEIPNISTIGEEKKMEVFSRKLRELMVGFGFQEVMCLTLTNKELLFGKMNLKERPIVEIANPKTEEYTICRDQILPSLLEVLSKNKHREFPQRIFELEDVVVLDKRSDAGARNVKKLGAVISDHEIGYSDIRAVVDAFLKSLGIEYKIKAVNHNSFIKGRVGSIITKREIGILGEISPLVLTNFGLENPVVGFEINVEELYNKVSLG